MFAAKKASNSAPIEISLNDGPHTTHFRLWIPQECRREHDYIERQLWFARYLQRWIFAE